MSHFMYRIFVESFMWNYSPTNNPFYLLVFGPGSLYWNTSSSFHVSFTSFISICTPFWSISIQRWVQFCMLFWLCVPPFPISDFLPSVCPWMLVNKICRSELASSNNSPGAKRKCGIWLDVNFFRNCVGSYCSILLHELAVVCREQENLTAAAFFVSQSKGANISKDDGYCWCVDIEGTYYIECLL